MSNKILRVNDFCRSNDNIILDRRISFNIKIYNEEGTVIINVIND